MATESKCPICGSGAVVGEFVTQTHVQCERCGNFFLGSRAAKIIGNLSKPQWVTISGWIRENQDVKITEPMLPFLEALRMPSVGEKAESLLRHLAKKFPAPGQTFSIDDLALNQELQGVARAETGEELRFLFYRYLRDEKQFVLQDNSVGPGPRYIGWNIGPKGWSFLDSLRQPNPESHIGFIAIWFDDSVTSAWKAIDKAIATAGYSPFRVDQKQHNNKIDDEIVAAIRRSKFLVADFTGHRGGVYFESGLAMGLGLPVIWLCRHDELKKTHFDTRQYNFIVWTDDKLPELTNALLKRIEATIGRGPLPPPAMS